MDWINPNVTPPEAHSKEPVLFLDEKLYPHLGYVIIAREGHYIAYDLAIHNAMTSNRACEKLYHVRYYMPIPERPTE